VEDGSGQREDVRTANRASVAGAARHPVVLPLHAALSTESDSTRPTFLHHVFETRAIVGELGLKLLGGVLLLGRDGLTAVHGDLPFLTLLYDFGLRWSDG